MNQQEFDKREIPVLQKRKAPLQKKNQNTAIKKNYHIHKIILNENGGMEWAKCR